MFGRPDAPRRGPAPTPGRQPLHPQWPADARDAIG